MTINCHGNLINLSETKILGILNLTPDSFYDGGTLKNEAAIISKTEKMLLDGADFIDLGGYSSRPGAKDISTTEEIKRVAPIVKLLTKQFPNILISIDTFRSEVAKTCLDNGAALINDISAASRLDAELSRIEMAEINITDLLSTLIDIRSSTMNCKINFFKEVDMCYVWGNEYRIAQVFDNLIQNAASFSTNNCRIDIRLEKDSKKIIILVEDNGPGFSKVGMNKVFDRFYTERPKTEKFGNHSGLGLSISKQILVAHGGTIEVFNRLNHENKCVGATVKTSFNELKL